MIITHVISGIHCSCPRQQLDQAEHIANQYKAPQLMWLYLAVHQLGTDATT